MNPGLSSRGTLAFIQFLSILISMKPHFLDVTKPPDFMFRGRLIQNPGSSRESPMPRRGVCGLESANWVTKKPKPTRVRSEFTSKISRKPRLPRDSSLAMCVFVSRRFNKTNFRSRFPGASSPAHSTGLWTSPDHRGKAPCGYHHGPGFIEIVRTGRILVLFPVVFKARERSHADCHAVRGAPVTLL